MLIKGKSLEVMLTTSEEKFESTLVKNSENKSIIFPVKDRGFIRYIAGGSIFGLGWALVGACPGPMYILLGTGVYSMLIVIVSAIIGTFIYGVLKDKLPH